MADIFVSYSSEDRKRVEPLVDLLKQQGWSVWWDRDLIAGPSFDREIEKALHQARCVVVVWSHHSIESTWCRAEATDAQEREILVPIVIDDVRPPLAFRAAQTASLIGWPRSQDNTDRVLDGISACLGAPRPTPTESRVGPKKTQRLIATIVGALTLAAVALWLVVDTQSPADVPITVNHDIVRIAVLPFEDFSTTGDNAHIALGIQEDIIARLAEIDELEVTSRSSTRRFSQANERSMTEIARDLSVSHVVEGSVRRSADQVRVSIQLIDANTDSQLWAESYDRELNNIFALQTDVAHDVAGQLEKNFSNQAPTPLAQPPTDDLQAYELVLKGRELLADETAKSLTLAAELMAQAVARDPGLAAAHAGLARALFLLSVYNTSWSEVRTQALQASERALELDPNSASIHTNYAHMLGTWEGKVETARQHYQKAIELEPNNAFSLLHYGAHLAGSGEVEKGLPYLQRAMTLDPLSGEVSYYLAGAHTQLGNYEAAIKIMQRGLKFNPDYVHLLIMEFFFLFQEGEPGLVFERLHNLVLHDPHNLQILGIVAYVLLHVGEPEAAQLWVDRVHTLSPTHENYFDAQRVVYTITEDIDGLTQLVGAWHALNTSDRASRDPSTTTSFAALCQLQILALRADIARANNDRDTEQVLRTSAIEIAQEILTGAESVLGSNSDLQAIALTHAIHQRLTGQEQEATKWLNTILLTADDQDAVQLSTITKAYALLGDNTKSIDFFRSRSGQLNSQPSLKAIRENRFGLYDSIVANSEFVELLDEGITANEALQVYLHTELPSLLTATTGL